MVRKLLIENTKYNLVCCYLSEISDGGILRDTIEQVNGFKLCDIAPNYGYFCVSSFMTVPPRPEAPH